MVAVLNMAAAAATNSVTDPGTAMHVRRRAAEFEVVWRSKAPVHEPLRGRHIMKLGGVGAENVIVFSHQTQGRFN